MAAVIVTCNRQVELIRLLGALRRQSLPLATIVVVDNGSCPEMAEVLREHGVTHYVKNIRNLGGAGGFALGILHALGTGASHLWLMDDDGLPESTACLVDLVQAAEDYQADVVSPLVVDIDNAALLSFPYVVHWRRCVTRADLAGQAIIRNFAHLFNGTLLRADSIATFGIPDIRLFIRGDEVDFLHRVRRGGGRILTLTDVVFLHPSGRPEVFPVLGGHLNAVYPEAAFKQFYFFRNRGYLLRKHRLVLQFASDLVRYPWYFGVNRRGDWRGLVRWVKWSLQGFLGDFRPFAPANAERRTGRTSFLERRSPVARRSASNPHDGVDNF